MTATLALTFAEAESCWVTWQWTDRPGPEAAQLAPDVLVTVPTFFAQTLPDASVGESVAEAMERAKRGPLNNPADTALIAGQLADGLIPWPVVMELVDRAQRDGQRPRLRILPSPSLAQVPWPMLLVRLTADGSKRVMLAEIADVYLGVPGGVAQQARPTAVGDAVVMAVDPRVPGYAADSVLGSVLGRPKADDILAQLLERHAGHIAPPVGSYPELVRRTDLDRSWLRDALRDAARFLFVGHVSAAGVELATGESSALHLGCVDAQGVHAPLTAHDIMTDDDWRFPSRVALMGCGSGTDLRYPEPLGLTMAAVLAGAQLVTSAAWTLPTDAALEGEPLRRLILAVDEAHASPDPVAALNAWQVERAAAWADSGQPADSPLVWAAVHTHLV
ncbi:MAG: CHAT domain-containing protein [Propionibacteriaceae bacterium]|nr:CHAT domain-containing protein [Propionibacteriaceae bacterium]